jgi:hypothetical protein
VGGFADWLLGGTTDITAPWVAANGGSRDMNYQRSNAWYNRLNGNGPMNPENWFKQASGYANGAQGDLLEKMRLAAGRSGQDIFSSFQTTQPQMQDMAGRVADAGISSYGSSMNDLAKVQSQEAIRALENRFGANGGLANGAAMASMARGASEPLLQALAQIAQLRANAFQGGYLPMANAGYARELGRTDEYGRALGGANQSMQSLGQIGGTLGGWLNDQSQQYWLAPQLQVQKGALPGLLGTAGTVLGGIYGGPAGAAIGGSAGNMLGNVFTR